MYCSHVCGCTTRKCTAGNLYIKEFNVGHSAKKVIKMWGQFLYRSWVSIDDQHFAVRMKRQLMPWCTNTSKERVWLSWYLFCCAVHTVLCGGTMGVLLQGVSADMLQPRYGLHMRQAAALLLVPDNCLFTKRGNCLFGGRDWWSTWKGTKVNISLSMWTVNCLSLMLGGGGAENHAVYLRPMHVVAVSCTESFENTAYV